MSGINTKKHGDEVRERILKSIISYIEEHGYSPSYKEIGEMVGLKSKNTVYNHIQRMFETGMLETDADFGSARAIRIPNYKFVKVENEND